jgi:hypothetical protein
MINTLRAKPGTDCGMQVSQLEAPVYRETVPSLTVKQTLLIFNGHRAIKSKLGHAYYVYISDLVCNPLRNKINLY